MKPFCKDWEKWLFLQMYKTQEKKKHIKNQGNKAQSMKQNKPPETKSKETAIY